MCCVSACVKEAAFYTCLSLCFSVRRGGGHRVRSGRFRFSAVPGLAEGHRVRAEGHHGHVHRNRGRQRRYSNVRRSLQQTHVLQRVSKTSYFSVWNLIIFVKAGLHPVFTFCHSPYLHFLSFHFFHS